jgi:hypothetical protein
MEAARREPPSPSLAIRPNRRALQGTLPLIPEWPQFCPLRVQYTEFSVRSPYGRAETAAYPVWPAHILGRDSHGVRGGSVGGRRKRYQPALVRGGTKERADRVRSYLLPVGPVLLDLSNVVGFAVRVAEPHSAIRAEMR